MAAADRQASRVHRERVSSQQRLYFTTLLIVVAAAFPAAAQDFDFDPGITQQEFHELTAIVSQAVFASPVDAAEGGGLLDFEVGIAATAVPIDENAAYWVRSVNSDLTTGGYLMVPRLTAAKGIGLGRIWASYAQIPDSDVQIAGAAFDFPLLRGGLARPTLAIRATYTQILGIDEFDLQAAGAEVFLSKGFGPLTPYASAGVVHTRSEGRVTIPTLLPVLLEDQFEQERITVGLRISLLVPKIVIEATQAEERTYAAKVSLGL